MKDASTLQVSYINASCNHIHSYGYHRYAPYDIRALARAPPTGPLRTITALPVSPFSHPLTTPPNVRYRDCIISCSSSSSPASAEIAFTLAKMEMSCELVRLSSNISPTFSM